MNAGRRSGKKRRGQIPRREPESGAKAPAQRDARQALSEQPRLSLERLYEISKLLMDFENVEVMVSSILSILTEALPLRSAILIVEVDRSPRTIAWKGLGEDALAAAKAHARVSYGYLVGADAADSLSLENIQTETSRFFGTASKDPAAEPSDRNRFILLPLVIGHRPIFGALQLEAASTLDETDLMLVNAVVNQLAIALDRHQAWRQDIALREHAESLYKQIAESERRKDEFLAMLGHELRNPLAPISTALELLRLHGVKEGGQKSALEVLERQLQHLTRLVDDLLDVSRITRRMIHLEKKVLNLDTVVERAVESSRSLIESRRHELSVDVTQEGVRLEADPVRLVQVISNLLNNAAKYTEPGGRIWLTAELAGGEVVIRVRDTGIGIAPEMLDEVFKMFTQVAPSLARSEGGLGVGLALVRTLVEMHGGRVEARSAGLGQGSEFVVRLPALSEALSEVSAPELEAAAVPGQSVRVLVVDDNVDSATGMAEMLKLWGYDVQLAYDGQGAIEAALEYRPRVVLLDIGLPGMDGYEVARRLRGQHGFSEPALLLVALTGYGQEEERQRAKEAGIDVHLTKPVDVAALRRVLATKASNKLLAEIDAPGKALPNHGARSDGEP